MPPVRNAYECSRCESMMKSDERTVSRTTLTGPDVSAQYTEDLCPRCTRDALRGRTPKGVRRMGKGTLLILPDMEESRSDT